MYIYIQPNHHDDYMNEQALLCFHHSPTNKSKLRGEMFQVMQTTLNTTFHEEKISGEQTQTQTQTQYNFSSSKS